MADTKIYTTRCFERRMAGAHIRCTVCRHSITVSPAVIDRMFPKRMLIDDARRALKCSLCGAKQAEISPVWRPQR